MSTFYTRTNRARVDKMLKLIGHLEISARSNKATPDDWAQLLKPLADRIAELTAGADDAAAPAAGQSTLTHWHTGIHMAREIPIEEVPWVASVLTTRLEEYFDDLPKGA